MLNSLRQDDTLPLPNMMGVDELTLPLPEDSDELTLIAYLDGELEPDEKELLEQRLRNEPQLQKKLSELDQTWNVLNFLDSQPTESRLVCKTLQMIALQTQDALKKTTSSTKIRKPTQKWIYFALLFLFVMGIGYFSLNFFLNRNQQQTIDDLFLIERLDQYMLLDEKSESGIDEIEFLKKLYESKILE